MYNLCSLKNILNNKLFNNTCTRNAMDIFGLLKHNYNFFTV